MSTPTTPAACAAIRFILMTGLRRMEALSLRLDDVDARTGCVHLRESKSGELGHPVGRAALAVLETVPRREDSPWASRLRIAGLLGSTPEGDVVGPKG